MIKEINIGAIIDTLSYSDVYEGKIKTLYRSYGGDYKFCTFLKQDDSLLISKLDRDVIIKVINDNYNADELAAYLKACNAFSVFLPPELARAVEPFLDGEYRYNLLMEYNGRHVPSEIDGTPNLTDVFEILKEYFYIEYSSWLTDVSHRVRHGISKVFLYKGASTVTALYDEDDMVFLTQVATKTAMRGKGLARGLLSEVAGRYYADGKTVRLVCRSQMLEFYNKMGFVKIGEAAQIYR